jgi:hypothetical protein
VEARKKGGEDEGNAGGEEEKEDQVGQEKNDRGAGGEEAGDVENGENYQVEEEGDHAGEIGGEDEGFSGEIELGDEVAFGDQAVHAGLGGFGEIIPEDDAEEEVNGVILHRAFQENRENEVDDAEKHEGFEKRPEIAKNGGFVAEFKFAFDQLGDDFQVLAEGGHGLAEVTTEDFGDVYFFAFFSPREFIFFGKCHECPGCSIISFPGGGWAFFRAW